MLGTQTKDSRRLPRVEACAPQFEASGESLQKTGELRCGPELRHRLQFLKRPGERIRQAPHRARLEVLVLRVEIKLVDFAVEVVRDIEFGLHERAVDDELCGDV